MSGNVTLRALEPSDVDLLYRWENDPAIWKYSNTLTPFSRFVLEQYVMDSHQDIFSSRQLRLMIDVTGEDASARTVGTIDLFDFDPVHLRAGIGIMIAPGERGMGYSSAALEEMIRYAFNTLKLHLLWCNVAQDNAVSMQLFESHGFKISGVKKEWLNQEGAWADEFLLQLINPK